MYLTELASYEKEGIEGQLNHATCIINALSDIKPEIENVIKMGRKIVESEAVVQVNFRLIKKKTLPFQHSILHFFQLKVTYFLLSKAFLHNIPDQCTTS
jgi:hypothetical protein